MLPDLDTLGFKFGIAYADAFGHRGALHSLLFALCVATSAALLHRRLHAGALGAFAFVGMAAVSHPLLDMLTDGGLGIAIAWPLTMQRYFFPWHPIQVSPIGMRFFSVHSVLLIASELLWVWVPVGLLSVLLWRWRIVRDGPR